MNKKAGQKRSPVSWLMELAAPRRWEYLFISVPPFKLVNTNRFS